MVDSSPAVSPFPALPVSVQVAGTSTVVLPAGADSGYDCAVCVTDSFVTVSSQSAFVPVAFALLDFSQIGRASCRERV